MARIARFAVVRGAERRSLFVLGALSVGDFFVPALPTQTSVIALGLLQPARWLWVATVFAAAAGTGTLLLAAVLASVTGYAQSLVAAPGAGHWASAAQHLRDWGVWAVLLFSIFPTPPRLLTAAALLSGAGAVPVAGAVFAGRLVWLTAFLLLLTRAPHGLARVPLLGPLLARFEAFRAEVLAEAQGQRP
jgi:hypothetical protein